MSPVFLVVLILVLVFIVKATQWYLRGKEQGEQARYLADQINKDKKK